MKYGWIFIIGIISVISCKKEEVIEDINSNYTLDFTGLNPPQLPSDNPLTVKGVALGRKLFYDKLLSSDKTISCASCHVQEFAFADTNRFSIGVDGKKGKRQAMAIFNMAWNTNDFFWDGRAHSLREQSLMPIQDPLEMNETLDNIVKKLNNHPDYPKLFKEVFKIDKINDEYVSLALEQFMFTIVSNNSKYDKVERGKATYTDSELRGKKLFFTTAQDPNLKGANCSMCHGGSNFENDEYMNNGLDKEADITDLGRQKVYSNPLFKGTFKVPSLRNIELTPPYMHDGRFNTLEEVIDHYNHGVQPSQTLNATMASIQNNGGLKLNTQDKKDLIAFLKTLTDHNLTKNSKFSDPN
jgi:cytochrome c peroxidase